VDEVWNSLLCACVCVSVDIQWRVVGLLYVQAGYMRCCSERKTFKGHCSMDLFLGVYFVRHSKCQELSSRVGHVGLQVKRELGCLFWLWKYGGFVLRLVLLMGSLLGLHAQLVVCVPGSFGVMQRGSCAARISEQRAGSPKSGLILLMSEMASFGRAVLR
jgi:hypothetical protein